ncbi:hypothetical protein G6729_01695 [Polynucleobacter paneuropaeus]|nr:hypothetical protein G6729_01695 [Polynucleobacter paneuropaeus]
MVVLRSLNKLEFRWEFTSKAILLSSLVFLIFWYSPFSLGQDNLGDYDYHKLSNFLYVYAATISLLSIVILLIAMILSRRYFILNKLLYLIFDFLIFLYIAILIYKFLLPNSSVAFDGRTIVGVGNFFPFTQNLSYFIDLTVLIISFLIYKNIDKYKFSLFLIYPLIYMLIAGFIYSRDIVNNKIELSNNIEYSVNNNIILFLFDGMSNKVIKEILNDNTNLKDNIFSNFNLYDNAITKHPGTWGSLGEILGGKNFSIEEIQKNGKKPLNMAYRVAPMSTIQNFEKFGYKSNYMILDKESGGQKNNITLNYILIGSLGFLPYFTRSHIYSDGLWGGLPNFIFKRINGLNGVIGGYLKKSIVDPLDRDGNFYLDAKLLFDAATVNKDLVGSLNIFYFGIPHAPFYLDNKCKKIPESSAFSGYKSQSECALSFAIETIKFLKENGIYSQSRILIASDHGWPWLQGSVFNDVQLIKGGGYQGRITVDMIGSTLLYKPEDVKVKQLKVNKTPIYVQDSLSLLCSNHSKCPPDINVKFQNPNIVFTTSTSQGTWDDGPFKITGKYIYKGDYRDPGNWSVIFEK